MVTKKKEKIALPIIEIKKEEKYIKIFPDVKEYEPIKYSINWFAVRKYINNIKIIGVIRKDKVIKFVWGTYCEWFNSAFNEKETHFLAHNELDINSDIELFEGDK